MTAALFVVEQGSAVELYRARLPGRGLMGRGWTVWHTPVLVERPDGRLVGWDGRPGAKVTPMAKVVVTRHLQDPNRLEEDSTAMFTDARAAGQSVFVDLDDNLWELDSWNPAAPFYTAGELARLEANLAASSGVLCSTPTLAEVVADHLPDGVPIWVCPPPVDATAYRPHRETVGPLRVGWMGWADWRLADFEMIAATVTEVVQTTSRPEVRFVHIGASSRSLSLRDAFPDLDVIEIPEVAPLQLPQVVHTCDIALVPMLPGPTNDARSATTGLAFAAAGIPFVASPTPAYVELAATGAGVLADKAEEWAGELHRLIDSAEGRLLEGEKARRAALEHWSPRGLARYWEMAFEQQKGRRR